MVIAIIDEGSIVEDEEGYPPFTPLKAAEIAARMKKNRPTRSAGAATRNVSSCSSGFSRKRTLQEWRNTPMEVLLFEEEEARRRKHPQTN